MRSLPQSQNLCPRVFLWFCVASIFPIGRCRLQWQSSITVLTSSLHSQPRAPHSLTLSWLTLSVYLVIFSLTLTCTEPPREPGPLLARWSLHPQGLARRNRSVSEYVMISSYSHWLFFRIEDLNAKLFKNMGTGAGKGTPNTCYQRFPPDDQHLQ